MRYIRVNFWLESIWNLNISRTLFLWRSRITLRLKMESSRHRISLSRISESTPAVVQENGLAVRKRLGLLSKAIAVSSLFSEMILSTCSQRAQWTKYNMKLGKRRVFSCYYGARTIPIPDTTANRAFPIHCRIILPLGWCSRIKIFPDMIFLHWRRKLPYFHSNLTAKTCQTHVSYSHLVYT